MGDRIASICCNRLVMDLTEEGGMIDVPYWKRVVDFLYSLNIFRNFGINYIFLGGD